MTDTAQIRPFRAGGVVLLQIIVALFGVPILEPPVGSILKFVTNSPASIIIREWICSIMLGGFFGAAIYLRWKLRSSQWIWVAGIVFLLWGYWQLKGRMIQPWHVLSGAACVEHPGFSCLQFWTFSAPLIRLSFYSLGAFMASRLSLNAANRVSMAFSDIWSTIFMKAPDLEKDSGDYPTGKNPQE